MTEAEAIAHPLRAAEPWKCSECRRAFGPGSTVIQYVPRRWFGCPNCAVLTSCGQPAIFTQGTPCQNSTPEI